MRIFSENTNFLRSNLLLDYRSHFTLYFACYSMSLPPPPEDELNASFENLSLGDLKRLLAAAETRAKEAEKAKAEEAAARVAAEKAKAEEAAARVVAEKAKAEAEKQAREVFGSPIL